MMHHFNDRSHSGLDSESESIDVYVPSSEYGSPASRRDGLNSNYESIVICNEVDIESELNKARDPTDTDSMFKILSMNFYDKKPCSKEENVFTCPGLTLNSERSHKSTFSNKNSEVTPKPRPSAGSTTLPKQLLHHNFFNVDKIKLMNQALAKLSPSNAAEISPAKHKQSNPNRYSLLINPRPSLKSPTNSVKSPKDIDIHRYTLPSTTKAEKTAQKPRTSLQTKKEVKNKPVNAEPRGSLLAKQQSPKNAWKPHSVNKTIQTLQKELSFRNSTKPVMSESTPKNSVSPRVRVPESKPKGKQMAQKTASLKEQILQTLAKKIPSKKPPAKQSLLVKNELSLSKQVLSNPTKSKRGTIEYMSVSIAKEAEKESTKKTEANGTSGYRPFQRLRTYDDDDNARALALMPPKNLSAKNAANENFKKAQASGFLFHSENVKVNIQDVISKKAALRVLQNLKGKLRGISLTGSNKPKESKGTSDKELYSHQRFYFKSKLNMTANERTKDTDSTNCKDSFVSLQSKTLEI